jgi:hypothetical protein
MPEHIKNVVQLSIKRPTLARPSIKMDRNLSQLVSENSNFTLYLRYRPQQKMGITKFV